MKKLLKTLLCTCMFIGLVACNANMPNPIEEKKTLEDINEEVGGNLIRPEGLDITNERFDVINEEYPVAEYNFEANGLTYCFRFSKAPLSVDISGVYFRGEPLYTEEDCSLIFSHPDDNTYVSRWPGSGGQYTIMCEGDCDMSDFMNMVYEITYVVGEDEISCDLPEPTSTYTVTIEEDGDNLVYTSIPNEGSTDKNTHRTIFYCEGEKIVKVISETIYENAEDAKNDYDFYLENFPSAEVELNGNVLTSVTSKDGAAYDGFTRSDMLKSLQDSADYENGNN